MKKTTLFIALTAAIFLTLLNSCGNSSESGKDAASAESMVADEPKDDGQGIGKFKNVTPGALDKTLAGKGLVIFEAKCSACHKTTDQKVVGPGLAGITKKRSAAWILNMITNPEEMTKKDPAAMALLEEHLTQMTFQDVSDDDAKALLEYLRLNDGEGTEQAAK